jgi:hypothetical protein
MTTFQKLNLKEQSEIFIFNAPKSFEKEIASLKGVTVKRAWKDVRKLQFALVFAVRQSEVDAASECIARLAEGDAVIWFAYPKGTSKRYMCDFNRDTGWNRMNEAGFVTVRAVAIDEDWSGLRFRRREFVKK